MLDTQLSGDSETRQISRSMRAPCRRPAKYHSMSASSAAAVAVSTIGHTACRRSTACALAITSGGQAGTGTPPWSSSTTANTISRP